MHQRRRVKPFADQRPLWMRIWWNIIRSLIRFLGAIFYRVRYTGLENIPAEGAVVIASNHQSNLDPPLIGAGPRRRVNSVARKSLYRFTPFAMLLRSLDAIPLDQEGSALGGIRETLRRLKRGEVALIFPEGARTLDGQMTPFLPGISTLARRSDAAIVPTAIEGAYDAWPRSASRPRLRLGRIHIHFGPPISPDEISRLTDEELLAGIERRVKEYLAMIRARPEFASK